MEKGNTLIVIVHNLYVIQSAGWIVDLGPEGGKHGGMVLAEVEASFTGQFLGPLLAKAASGCPLVQPSQNRVRSTAAPARTSRRRSPQLRRPPRGPPARPVSAKSA